MRKEGRKHDAGRQTWPDNFYIVTSSADCGDSEQRPICRIATGQWLNHLPELYSRVIGHRHRGAAQRACVAGTILQAPWGSAA